ncbi:replication factor A [Natronococcus amylolyticus DSM 10524]|uniref:Replication factor A n=1 Tax=Natronococcus amylolyticus DSM 10524 TaxID=1227497 RepID=L9XGP4_9EURY|nr:single-stranded DNA binding protein [Natronococcus amylolyticus]ELY59853.1 replication factor A [Natronococcus amylolyticus DSM 10524]
MSDIEGVYEDLEADVSLEEFREAVEEKVDQMGGLADEETAAMLIAHEIGESEVGGVADVEPGMEEAKFVAKVIDIGEMRTFERDGEDEDGRVVNVEVADETGSIRAAFWDDHAAATLEELEEGQVLRIKGRPKEGFSGVEVSVDEVEPDPDTEIDVQVSDVHTVEALSLGLSSVNLVGVVLDTDTIRTFDRDDGSEGKVANLVVGDSTGRIRVTMWDERAEQVTEFEAGDTLEVVDGYVRERDGSLELHVGNRGALEAVDADVEYVPESVPIEDVEIGQTVDIAGVVRSADPKRTFDRDDGSEGQVRNIRVQDATGDIRVALWGSKADTDLGPGDEVALADVEIQDGWQDDLEASAGWQSTVTVLDSEAGSSADADDGADSDGNAGLSSFAEGDDGASTNEAASTADDGDDAGPDEPEPGEEIEFTGVVVQAGDPVVLDDGETTMSVTTEATVGLGEEITARGVVRDGRLEASDVF